MTFLLDEILAAEREHSLGVQMLPAADRDQLRERIFSWYGRSDRIWERVDGCASVQDSRGWEWIHEFVGARSCVLLFDLSNEAEMFQVPSGPALHELLANTFGFVFYVTDTEVTYLICFNDHGFLIGCGSAREWIERRM
jgi:hypothetical protein